MSWQEVDFDLSNIQTCLNQMEEGEEEGGEPVAGQLHTGLLSEIMDCGGGEGEARERERDVSHSSATSQLGVADQPDRRGSAGILRRPSLGLEAVQTSPGPSADRLSVTFAMETVSQAAEEPTGERGDTLLGSLRRTVSSGSGLGRGSSSYLAFPSPDPDTVSQAAGEEEYSAGLRELAEGRRSSGGSRSKAGRSGSGQQAGQDQHGEQIRLHREVSLVSWHCSHLTTDAVQVLEQARLQLWPLDRKLRLVRAAKLFLAQQEREREEELRGEASCWSFTQQASSAALSCET